MAKSGDTFPLEIDTFGNEDTELNEEWKKLAEDLLGEKEEEIKQKLIEIRTAVSESEDIKKIGPKGLDEQSDQYFVRFLRAANWSVPSAVSLMTCHYKMCRHFPQFMFRKQASELSHVWESRLNGSILSRDQHGRRVYFFRVHKWDADTATVADLYISKTIMFDMMLQEAKTQVAGITVVYDFKGYEMRHFTKFGLNELRFIGEFVSGGFPVWIRHIHVINNPKLLDITFNLTKPFLSKRIRNNITFHGTDLNSLHDAVPRALLPEDIGGETDDVDNTDCVRAAMDRQEEYKKFIDSFTT